MQFYWATKTQSPEEAGRLSVANRMTIFLSITRIMEALVFLVCGIAYASMLYQINFSDIQIDVCNLQVCRIYHIFTLVTS